MPGPDTAVEEAPVLIGFLIALVEFLIAIQLLAVLWTYKHTIGYVLQRFAVLLRFHVPWVGTIDLSGPVNTLNDSIVTALGKAAYLSQNNAGNLFHAAASLQLWMVHETAAVAGDVFRWGDWLQRKYLPSWLKGALLYAFPVGFLTKLVYDIVRRFTHHQTVVAHSEATTATNEHARTRTKPLEVKNQTLAKIVAAAAAVGIALPWVHIFPRVKALENWGGHTRKRLRRVEKVFAAAGAAAIMANALGLGHNWRCITRGNIGRVARHLCGLGPRALEDLLGLLADVLILQNICTVITVIEDGFNLIEPELTAFITTAETQFVHCGYDLPTVPSISLPYLPPVTGVVLNQAA